MKKVFLVLAVICFSGQALALTVVKDGNLVEWVGDEINYLGTEPAPDGNSYTLLATWDGVTLNFAMDRASTSRYLGDIYWDNDSFFVAIDADGIDDSGATSDGYGRVNFSGPKLPDMVYYFAGGDPGDGYWERSIWNGLSWTWMGWAHDTGDENMFYGYADFPYDEFDPPLVNDLINELSFDPTDHSELPVWMWITREGDGYVEASWPQGTTGVSPTFEAPIKVRDEATLLTLSRNPSPTLHEKDVLVAGLELSWYVPQDPCGTVNPNLDSFKLYMSDGTTDHNLVYIATIPDWNDTTLLASYTPNPELITDGLYFWRVDTVLTGPIEVDGAIWSFYTEIAVPIITGITHSQIVDAGATANFTIDVNSPSAVSYQWLRYVDGGSDVNLSDGGDISGATTDSLSIENVESADEAYYYCDVNNLAGQATSDQVPLAIKRKIAHWDFESASADSNVAGSPVSVLYGDPIFVATGILGDAMEFDNDANAEDLLYTDPCEASYFDICNYNMTVACWIKSTYAATWGPMVARNGEDNGWQLRHNGDTLDRICFTTRGTGNDDGTASNRTVYDGPWHYAVGTYDGVIKKVYIDGVLSRVYSGDDGSVAQEYDVASGAVDSSPSPVALAGRVKGDPINGLEFEGYSVTPCILDEVEIYNYALDAAVIAQTYADIAGTAVCPDPTVPAYDLDGDCIVNLNDLAKLASEWLDDTSVQPTP